LSIANRYAASLDEAAEYLNVLYYGEPGCGKTTAAAGLARLGTVYLVDVESGAKPSALRKRGIPTSHIRPVPVETYKDLDDFYWYLKQEIEDTEPGTVAGVVFDSISEIHDQLIRGQVDKRHDKAVRKASNPRTGELLTEVEDNEFLVELGDRGIVTEQLRIIARRFRDLKCHTVFVALAKREVESEGQVYLPQLPPKFGGNLRGFVDQVCFLVKADGAEDDSGYLGVFRDTGRYKGKDRLDATPPVMANPSMDRLISLTFGDLDLSRDEAQNGYLSRVLSRRPAEDGQDSEASGSGE